MPDPKAALIALDDGTVLKGTAFGARKTVVGEACFNTSMTGYQEILSDPSYSGQIVTMTAPQIGNYGVNPEDMESDGPKAAGFVVRELSTVASNWRSRLDLPSFLEQHSIPGIENLDTRTLVRKLRITGAMKACLSTEGISPEEAVERARGWSGLVGRDFVREVTCSGPFTWSEREAPTPPFSVPGTSLYREREGRRYTVAAMDFGAKYSIFRKLTRHGFDVAVFPADTPEEAIREHAPDALFLSNGPGDPAALPYAHQSVAALMKEYPTFGICLGHQILTHALGAETFKLKFGHRGGNQPVRNLETGKVSITSQNHGFASTREELEGKGAIVTEVNLNDDTVEGLRLKDYPVFSVQYHPEAAPGPSDADPLFTSFYDMVHEARH
ncbi:MAG: glutamine-hydrolyzing carbamoyl-phosphate synthase small subunit [Opitutales bacterium]